jgi:hypothetical protein
LPTKASCSCPGPSIPDEAPGALLLFRADDNAHVDALVEKDPFTLSGVIAETDSTDREPVIGPLLPGFHSDRQAGAGTPDIGHQLADQHRCQAFIDRD